MYLILDSPKWGWSLHVGDIPIVRSCFRPSNRGFNNGEISTSHLFTIAITMKKWRSAHEKWISPFSFNHQLTNFHPSFFDDSHVSPFNSPWTHPFICSMIPMFYHSFGWFICIYIYIYLWQCYDDQLWWPAVTIEFSWILMVFTPRTLIRSTASGVSTDKTAANSQARWKRSSPLMFRKLG